MSISIDKLREKIRWLDGFSWEELKEVTPEAEVHVHEHVRRMRMVIAYLQTTEGMQPIDAYAQAQSVGLSSTPASDELIHILMDKVRTAAREHMTLAIHSYCFWETDSELGHLENPWAPMIELYRLGYTSSSDEDDELQTINVVIGRYSRELKSYKLI